jgi:hypothetical protein
MAAERLSRATHAALFAMDGLRGCESHHFRLPVRRVGARRVADSDHGLRGGAIRDGWRTARKHR